MIKLSLNAFFIANLLVLVALVPSAYSREPETYTGRMEPTNASTVPEEISGVNIKENLGHKIDLNLIVRDETGVERPLSSFFSNHKPVMLSPVYFACPGLCNLHFNGVIDVLKK